MTQKAGPQMDPPSFENEYKFDALAQCLNGVDGGGGGSMVVSVFVFTALWLFGGWQGKAMNMPSLSLMN